MTTRKVGVCSATMRGWSASIDGGAATRGVVDGEDGGSDRNEEGKIVSLVAIS